MCTLNRMIVRIIGDALSDRWQNPAHAAAQSCGSGTLSRAGRLVAMGHDADFCRAQAEVQQARADAAALPNVRTVALAAVERWSREAEMAELVAARRDRLGPGR
jgi:hypothetical protein